MSLNNLEGITIGKYKIERLLGEGGFGVTYKALDTYIDSYVAIKFLKSTEGSYWKDEARKAARLRDIRQIAIVYEFSEGTILINGEKMALKYIVWQYVEGELLDKFISNRYLTTDVIIDITEEICLGISAMQEEGLEHGDLHPNNIMIVSPKRHEFQKKYGIKILDFGLTQSEKNKKYNDMDSLREILLSCWNRNQ